MTRFAFASLFLLALLGCSSSANDGASQSADAGPSACKAAGGTCLGHNAPSAKGQGPATCAEFARMFDAGPLRSSPLSCEGEPVSQGGSIECCAP